MRTRKQTEPAAARPASIELALQTRAEARVVPESIDAEARSVELVWSTGAAVRRRDPWTGKPYDEVLSLEPAHVDLSRLNNGAPLLNTHGAFDLGDVLGVVERAWIASAGVTPGSLSGAGREGRAVVRFSARAEVEPIWRDVEAGILRNVSVGYRVRAYEITEEEGKAALWRAVDWQPLELSAVPVGADAGAGFRQGREPLACRLITIPRASQPGNPEEQMDDNDLAAAAPAEARAEAPPAAPGEPEATPVTRAPERQPEAPAASRTPAAEPSAGQPSERRSQPADGPPRSAAPDGAALQAAAERAVAAERERVAGIYDAARKLGLEAALADELVRRGLGLDAARASLIDHAAERDQALETRPQLRSGTLDETVTRRQAVEAALLHRYDPHRHPLSEPARDWRGLSLVEMARAFLEAEGLRVRGLSRDEIASRALHTTSDFPQLLAAVTNKTLREAYEAAPRTFLAIARRVSAVDFKQMRRLQLGEAPQLEKVGEAGEFKRGTLGEAQESYRVETYGKVIAITRQVIINDDLDAFTRVPALFGTAAATLESDVVWGIVTGNPAMADGNALFHASHKNLAGSPGALDVAGLGKARAAMARQTGLDGKTVLNIRPAFLIVPAALELTAEQLIAQNLVPATSADVVPASIRSLAVIAEPRLDPASGAVPWYLSASPSAIDTLEYAYLEGQEGVYIETRMGFDVDGVEVKARLDFGAKAIDWRGLYKNPGVALS